MKNKWYKILAGSLLSMMLLFTSCLDDLNTLPLDPNELTADVVFDKPESYKQYLAKIYAGLALSGQQGPSGKPDISGIDEGFSTYLRQYWKAQELPTDMAVIGWNDGSLPDYHDMDWTSSNEFITAMYNRIYYQVSLCNEFIRETTDAKLSERGVTGALLEDIKVFRAEVRFLRALSYWHAIDLFGNIPFVTEENSVGSFFPEQKSRTEMFNYVESELLAISDLLKPAKGNEYGRADQAAAWMLLGKLYLNAEVYTGTARYADAAIQLDKVVKSGYTLQPKYEHLFMADNHSSNEIIFPVVFDGTNARSWGGMTFIINAQVGGSMNPSDYGLSGGWWGLRTTKALVGKFYNLDLLKSAPVVQKSAKNYPVLYLPGGYQKNAGYSAGDWDPGTAPNVYSVSSDNLFEGYVYFPANSEFKFTEGPNWDNDWGDGDKDGTLDKQGGNNIKIADAGFYKINVDMNTKKYTIVKTAWGLIGDATPGGWDSDTDMTFDPASKIWSLTLEMGKGGFKFRANDNWDINLGGSPSQLFHDGGNIDVASPGKYTVTLDLTKAIYTCTFEKAAVDSRAMFHSDGQNLEIEKILDDFTQGWAITKYKNKTSTGQPGSHNEYVDTDFPMFRLADAYLMYAEALLRSNGSRSTALQYINKVRERAYETDAGNITDAELNLDFIIDERARELYWEGHRRTDLIRFGKFTGSNYIWPWKGGVKAGKAVEDFRVLYPIPSSDRIANPNLQQNTGY